MLFPVAAKEEWQQ